MRQDHQNTALSGVTYFQQTAQDFLFETAEAKVQLVLYSATVVRVRVLASHRSFEDHSYAVVSTPEKTTFSFNETTTGWLLQTEKLQLAIQKQPLRFELLNSTGHNLVGDDAAFGVSFIGNGITCYKRLAPEEKFIGLGEKTGYLNRSGQAYEHWNTDAFGYSEDSDPLYLSTPFYLGIHEQGIYGIFLDNSYRSVFNFGASNHRFSSFGVADGELNYYMFGGGTVSEIVQDYSWLTGRMPMPPKWSLGYQQCRYSYRSAQEVLQIARNFREKELPCDVIYLDIHYMDAYKVFSWHSTQFADPTNLVNQLKAMGFELVLIIDPGIKDEAGYRVRDELVAQGLYVSYPDGTPYTGDVWPGRCLFPDFTKPATRHWWGEQFAENIKLGINGFWNDMNEPVSWGKRMPDLLEFDWEGLGASHLKAHNQYGLQMARATFDGVKAALAGKRPFVLTRSGFSGIQRYAAVWTGDNVASNEHMLLGVRLMSSMGLAGIPFSGMDVGGFVGDADAALFTRWMQIGAFSPLFRGHSMINSRDAEPWSFGEAAQEIAANFIRLRYRLMPYIYSEMYQASQNGLPLVRSLAIDYTNDQQVYDNTWSNQYLFGPNLLVAAVDARQHIHKIYLPEGEWLFLYNDTRYQGGQVIMLETPQEILPVFVKAGSILPALSHAPAHQNAPASDEICLHIYSGGNTATFTLYEDDGKSYDFESGHFLSRTLEHDSIAQQIVLGKVTGNYPTPWSKLKLFFHGCEPKNMHIAGESLIIHSANHRFIEPISDFDPFTQPTAFAYEHKNLSWISLDWMSAETIISYSC